MSEESPPYGDTPTCPPGTHAFAHPIDTAAVCHCGAMYARVNGRHVVVSPIERTSAPYPIAPRTEFAIETRGANGPSTLLALLNERGEIAWAGEWWLVGNFSVEGVAGKPLCWTLECSRGHLRKVLYWYEDTLHAEKPT